ncbi:DUF5670 family protein [Winogradskyella schleiferi]|nr:DUF5670 family protein [Winogradskyella schleiferi]
MRSFLYIVLVLLIIFWALGYFVFYMSSAVHLLLLGAIIVLIAIHMKKS